MPYIYNVVVQVVCAHLIQLVGANPDDLSGSNSRELCDNGSFVTMEAL